MTQRTLAFLLSWMIVAAACTGGGEGEDSSDVLADSLAIDTASLKIAVMPTLDCLPLFVAHSSGIFQREGVSVCLMPFTAQMDCDTAIVGGTVDGLVTDLVRAERIQRGGTKLNYFAATNLQWQLLTGKTARIKQLSQLDDKMIAMTRFSGTALLADHLVDSVKLKSERVFRIQINDVLVRLNMLETGVMDAMLLPEPQATVARLLPSNLVYDSSLDKLCLGVLAFRERKNEPASKSQIEAFARAYDSACDSIAENGVPYYRDIIASWCHVLPAVADSLHLQHPVAFSHAAPPRQCDIDLAKAWLDKHGRKE